MAPPRKASARRTAIARIHHDRSCPGGGPGSSSAASGTSGGASVAVIRRPTLVTRRHHPAAAGEPGGEGVDADRTAEEIALRQVATQHLELRQLGGRLD